MQHCRNTFPIYNYFIHFGPPLHNIHACKTRKLSEARMSAWACCLVILVFGSVGIRNCCGQNLSRASFPKGFVFGAASSAYQYEGAVHEEGRGPTAWDKYAHQFGRVIDFSNADVAADHYHRYADDILLMKDMGMDAFKLSIAWSRIFPDGSGDLNMAGVNHYNMVINTLLQRGIQPYVTLFHWDIPQILEYRYNGWLSPKIIKDFTTYADTCFKMFGDRVKNWITFNEPHTFAVQGYDVGVQAPGRCSDIFRKFCRAGSSATEPYIVGHNILLSHASVVALYRNTYQRTQLGQIGISLDSFWFEPATNSTNDIEATKKAIDFSLGWFLEPLVKGTYPRFMRSRVRERLPVFTVNQSTLLRGSFNFIGINHFTTWYAMMDANSFIGAILNDSLADSGAIIVPIAAGKPVYKRANSLWLYIVPQGIRSLMNYIRTTYGNPQIFITGNGMDDPPKPFKQALKDATRIKYHTDYLNNLNAAIKDGCNVKGYFVWSLLDDWEWGAGYTSKFGLYYVDYKDNRKRYAKDSVSWFREFLKR